MGVTYMYEPLHGVKFSHFVRARTDVVYLQRVPAVWQLATNAIAVAPSCRDHLWFLDRATTESWFQRCENFWGHHVYDVRLRVALARGVANKGIGRRGTVEVSIECDRFNIACSIRKKEGLNVEPKDKKQCAR